MGRPIGDRLLLVIAVVTELGPCSAKQVFDCFPSIGMHHMSKYLQRGVAMGYLKSQVVSGGRTRYLYSAKSDTRPPPPKYSHIEDVWIPPVAVQCAPHYLHTVWR